MSSDTEPGGEGSLVTFVYDSNALEDGTDDSSFGFDPDAEWAHMWVNTVRAANTGEDRAELERRLEQRDREISLLLQYIARFYALTNSTRGAGAGTKSATLSLIEQESRDILENSRGSIEYPRWFKHTRNDP